MILKVFSDPADSIILWIFAVFSRIRKILCRLLGAITWKTDSTQRNLSALRWETEVQGVLMPAPIFRIQSGLSVFCKYCPSPHTFPAWRTVLIRHPSWQVQVLSLRTDSNCQDQHMINYLPRNNRKPLKKNNPTLHYTQHYTTVAQGEEQFAAGEHFNSAGHWRNKNAPACLSKCRM